MKIPSFVWWNLGALAIFVAILYWLWPELLHSLVFRYGILQWPIWVVIGIPAFFFLKRLIPFLLSLVDGDVEEGLSRRVVVYFALTIVMSALVATLFTVQNYGVYTWFTKFERVDTHVVSSTTQYRYTPLRPAYRIMNDSVNDAAENIEPGWTQPIILPDGFGYAAPVTPEGIVPMFSAKIESVMLYKDGPNIQDDKDRRVRVPVSFKYGPNMQWFDALNRKLVLNDFFTVYDDEHILAWNPEDPNDLVIAVPKIKYAFFMFPYWAGVTIVHPDGKLEDFTPEELKVHPRLKNQWTYPSSLARRYVKAQNFGSEAGILSPFFQMSGKLEIYKMPTIEPDQGSSAADMTTNQQPFLTQGADGNPYLVVMTKGQGGGSGLFRAYYVNAATGEGTFVEYDKDASIYGPNASMDPVKTVPGYNWRRQTKDSVSGNIVVVEPVYLVREKDPERFYWKGSVMPTNYRDVSATVVAPADSPQDFLFFRSRRAFEAWLAGEDDLSQLDGAVALKAQDFVRQLEVLATEAKEMQGDIEELLVTK